MEMQQGRPTDYRPEYGDQILALMTSGLSLTAAAADIGIHRQRVYEWLDRHPDFADAVNLARGKRTLFLEKRLLGATEGPVVTSSIFALKNACADEWREKVVSEHTGPNGGPIETKTVIDLSSLTDDELAAYRLVAAASARDRAGD